MFIAAIDFDGTIHNHEDREPGYKMGKPFEGAVEALQALKARGARIVIFTCRGRPDMHPMWEDENGSLDHVAAWLHYFGVPFDDITALKPIADVYVDDRAIPFYGDWESTGRELLALASQ